MSASQEFLSALEGWEPRPALEPDCPHEPMIITAEEERRLRRMISNRESARRSRMRKQRHLEDLRCQLNRLKSENRELLNRLRAATQYCLPFLRENDRLRSESIALRARLAEIRRTLLFRQLQRLASPAPAVVCAGFTPGAGGEPNFSSLIV